jgi:hypothetical protein
VCPSGACIDPANDPDNCNGCGSPCPPVANGDRGCIGGACVIGLCQPPFADCDGQVGTGCEANLNLDALNCGRCGHTCTGQGQSCTFGSCCGPPPAGSYQATCSSCTSCDGVLSCLCQDSGGTPVPTTFSLGACALDITNCGGVLKCAGC